LTDYFGLSAISFLKKKRRERGKGMNWRAHRHTILTITSFCVHQRHVEERGKKRRGHRNHNHLSPSFIRKGEGKDRIRWRNCRHCRMFERRGKGKRRRGGKGGRLEKMSIEEPRMTSARRWLGRRRGKWGHFPAPPPPARAFRERRGREREEEVTEVRHG